MTGNPTAALLWAACRPEPDLEAAGRAQEAGADLAQAAEAAVNHRVSGLLWRVVSSWDSGEEPWVAELRRDASLCRVQEQLLAPRLGEHLLAPLAEAELTPLVFKGLALTSRYPGPGLRSMDDVDIFLPPKLHGPARSTLARVGWRAIPKDGNHNALVLVHPELPGLPLELHQSLATWSEQSSRLTAEDMWNERRPVTMCGAPAFEVPPELELIALATHAAKPFHTFSRLNWSVDIAVVVGASPLDWEDVDRRARRARASTALAVALTHANRLGAGSPASLRQIRAGKSRLQALAPVLDEDWPVFPRVLSEQYRLGYALVDDPLLQLRLAGADIFEAGLIRSPARAGALAVKAGRKWWALRAQA